MSAEALFDSEQEEVRHKLEGLDHQAIVVFAARCAWRAAPWLAANWHSKQGRQKWMSTNLPSVQTALVFAMLHAREERFIAIYSDVVLYEPHKSMVADSASAAVSVALAATKIEAEKLAVAAANAALYAVGSRAKTLFRESIETDISWLVEPGNIERVLQMPLWHTSPSEMDDLWAEWQEVVSTIPAAGEFLDLMQGIHRGSPDWERLQRAFDAWWAQHLKNPEREPEEKSSSSQKKSAKAARPKSASAAEETFSQETPPEPKLRRIIQQRLVSTTSVTTDGEAEKLTPTARNCMLALREFLVSDETLPPLTVAVEAPWGGGKSSLMRHLQDALTNDSDATTKQRPYKEEPIPTVWFNPWKHEAGKTLWAAFAVAFERQLAGRLIWPWRVCVRRGLAFRRLTFGDWFMLAARLLVWLGVGWVLYWLWQHPDLVKPSGEKDAPKADVVMLLLQGAPWIGFPLLLWQLISTWNKEFGSPLKLDVSRLLTHNDHADQVDDLHRFHEDFRRLMRAYIPKRKNGKPGKAVVFIDDLDRCEAPKAAELLQSLHQMLNVQERSRTDGDKNAPGVICVLGMDREKVAAAVAAKHEKLLPLLKETDANGKVSRADAMVFGHEFLEKFIQLTLHLPAMQGNDLNEYLQSITGAKQITQTNKAESKTEPLPPAAASPAVSGTEKVMAPVTSDAKIQEVRERQERKETVERIERVSEDLGDGSLALQCAKDVAAALENNPRKLKQFVNLFRLRLYLAAAMNFLDLPEHDADKQDVEPMSPVAPGKLSVYHMAKLVALDLALPAEMSAIRDAPSQKIYPALERACPADTRPALHDLIVSRDVFQPDAYDLGKAGLEAYFHYFRVEPSVPS
ncbi:MAG: P-loop NTPase fold protein [Verrucomicrobiaceae bacterium]